MHAPIRLITYGSLMSGLGLQSLGRLTVTNAARVQLRNAHRGFGKPSRHGNHYAMILESVRPDAPIAAEPLAGSRHCPDGPQGLLLEIAFSDFLRIASREGYEPEALTRLAQVAEDTGSILPSFLWALLEAAHFDVVGYRRRLFALVNYTSSHYIPHPVASPPPPPALAFLPPGLEGTGNNNLLSARAAAGVLKVLSLRETWAIKPTASQLRYFAMCILAAGHNLSLHDLLAGIDTDPVLSTTLERCLAQERAHERQRFLHVLGWSTDRYERHFHR